MSGMVAYFYPEETRFFRLQYHVLFPYGLPVLGIALPKKYSSQRLQRLSRRLYQKGLRRFLAGDGLSIPGPLAPVDPLPLCRVKGAELALALLEGVAPRRRRVVIRGEKADPQAQRLAEELCPRVGAIFLEFDRGEEALARRLRSQYGAVALHLGQGQMPQLAVELSPRPPGEFPALRLWGEPDLLGLTLRPERALPPEFPHLPFLELLWETGRISPEELRPVREAEWP